MFTKWDRQFVDARFDRIESMLRVLMKAMKVEGERAMATVEELNAAVEELTVAVDSAVTAIGNNTGIDPAELDEAVATIKEQIGKLNSAVHAVGM